MFSHGNDSDLVLHRLRGGEHHHCLHQYVAQRLNLDEKELMGTTEIDIHELTEEQFHTLCELIGEDYRKLARLDENPMRVWYSPGDDSTVVRYTKMLQIEGNQLGRILGVTTAGTEEPVSSWRNGGMDHLEGPK